jgi:spore coat protein CotH
MGMEQTTYVGPYIKIKKLNIKPIETQKNERLFTCTSKSCNIHGKKAVGKFCSECGQKNDNIVISRKITEIPDGYDLLSDFGDEDFLSYLDEDKKAILYFPNRKKSYSIRVSSDDSFKEKEVTQNIEQITSSFSKDHQNFLDFLDQKDIQYSIKFGVVSYWW